jgi:hypothetical protein
MQPECLTALEDLIVSQLPQYVAKHRSRTDPLFTIRLNFYDTHAPECYFALALTYQSTAARIVKQEGAHSINKLWAGGESIEDEYIYFPETVDGESARNETLIACYQFLCDDDVVDSYRQYAKAICSAAFRINSAIANYFPHESEFFNLVPADDSFDFLSDDEAIRLAVPAERIANLVRGGYLDENVERFGIYPKDIYDS